jgi:hypothetical protein
MWRIVRAEIGYNRLMFLLFLVIMAMLSIYSAYRPISYLMAWLMLFLGVNTWLAIRIREKRDCMLARLPVPDSRVAWARILMILIPGAVFLGVFTLTYQAVDPARSLNFRVILMLYGLVVTIFSLALIFRDTFIGSKALKRGKIVLMVLVGALLLANVYTFIQARRPQNIRVDPPTFVRLIRYVEQHNPSTSNLNTLVFLLISFTLALLTVVTFMRRKTHIE